MLTPSVLYNGIDSTFLCIAQVRAEVRQLLEVSGASIVAAEAAYLRRQAEQIPVLEAESAALAACRHCAGGGCEPVAAAAAT